MHRSALLALALLAAPIASCSSDDGDDDDDGDTDAGTSDQDGGDTDAGESPTGCAQPDTECPNERPLPSGPCEGALSCDYLDANGVDTWTYTCAGGQWVADVVCNLDGGCPVPPLAELCLDPFAGSLEGATVEVGPADVSEPFHALTEDDQLPLIVGAQGGSMVTFRIAVSGPSAPACVGATIAVTADGVEAAPQSNRVALHCGVSLPVFVILPSAYCEPATVPIEIDVTVEGVGSAHAVSSFRSEGMCAG